MTTRDEDSGQRPCARIPAEWCSGPRIVTADDGTIQRLPGLTYRTFCDPCQTHIRNCLDEMPSAYSRLGEEIGEAHRGGQITRSPFGPTEPLHKGIDALMRYMVPIVNGWAARVRGVAKHHQPDPRRRVDTPGEIGKAAGILQENVGPLVNLQPDWMTRTFQLHPGRHGKPAAIDAELEELLGDFEIVRLGVDFVTVLSRPSGAEAGNEIIDMHYRARKILGETKTPPESFDGVPCRACEDIALERAEPPSDPKIPAKKSRCASCGDTMDAEEYAEWAHRYKVWAESADIPACRRCQRDRHAECAWDACPCRAAGHPSRTRRGVSCPPAMGVSH